MQSNPAAGIYGHFEFDISTAVTHIRQAIGEVNKLDKATAAVEKTSKEKAKSVTNSEKALKSEAEASAKAATASRLLAREMGSLNAVLASLTAVAVAGKLIRFTTEIEDGFVGVKRTTGAAGEQFQRLRQDILQLTGDLRGMDTRSIQDIATIGGQLGLSVRDLPQFTEIVAKSSYAMEMGAESAANFLARIGQNMKVPVEQFDRIANTSAKLANSTTATAAEILEISQRTSGTAAVFGLKPQEMLALATASRQAGVEIEVAGTAWSQILARMLTDIDRFAHVAGVDVTTFTNLLKNEPIKALETFATGLARFDKFGRVKALEDLQLDGVRVGQVLIKLAGNMDEFHDILKTANDEWARGSTVERAYEARAETLSASFSQLWNSTKLLADSIVGGSGLKGALQGITDTTSATMRALAGYGETLDQAAKNQVKLIDKTEGLYSELETLSNKSGKTADEQDRLNVLAGELQKIIPDLTVIYNEHGDVIGVNADQYKKLADAQRESAKAAKEAAKAELQSRHALAVVNITELEKQLEELKKQGGQAGIDAIAPTGQEFGAELTYRQWIVDTESRLNALKRRREEIYKQLVPQKETTSAPSFTASSPGTDIAGTPINEEGGSQKYTPYEEPPSPEEAAKKALDLAKQQIELDRRRALVSAKTADDRIAVEKKYYDSLAKLTSDKIELQRIELDRSDAIRAIETKSLDDLHKDQQKSLSDSREIAQQQAELSQRQIELNRRKAISTAWTTDEQITAEREYFNSLKKLADEQAANDIRFLDQSENYQEKILAIEEKNRLDREQLEQDFQDSRLDIITKAQEEEQREIEKQNRKIEQLMMERERQFRRVFEPLLRGQNLGDYLKDLMLDDLMDALAKSFSSSLNIPFGNGQGGIFTSLFSGIGGLFSKGISTSSTSPSTSILESGQLGGLTAPSMSWAMPSVSVRDSSSLGGVTNQSTSKTSIVMNINTGGAPFDQAAATSLKQTVKGIVEKTLSDDRRRNGRITQQGKR